MKKYTRSISQEHVATFMKAGGQNVYKDLQSPLEGAQCDLYFRLVLEEISELQLALLLNDPIEVADAIGDSIWVLLGLACTLGIDMDRVWQEIRVSNMSKFPLDGKPKFREDGKILKPDTFFEPDIKHALGIVEDD